MYLFWFTWKKFAVTQIEELSSNPSHSLWTDQILEIDTFLLETEGLSKHIDSYFLFNVKESPFYVPAPLQ
jgi:CCR4-NOT transcription complex subunit 1